MRAQLKNILSALERVDKDIPISKVEFGHHTIKKVSQSRLYQELAQGTTVAEFQVSATVYYTTHDNDELEYLIKRDCVGNEPYTVTKYFTGQVILGKGK